jgi:hypothetical protein
VGTYAETLLSDGEVIVRRARQHWLALILESRAAVGLWVLGLLLLLAIVVFFPNPGTARDVLSYVVIGAFVIGLLIFIWRWWNWRTEEYLVTNRRLLKVSGIFNKTSGDSSLEKINDAILFENLVGRMLDYGDLDILTAADVAVDKYRMLNHAKAFKIDMLNAKHTLEHEVAYVAMPSPPLRAATPTGETVPAPVASAAIETPIMAATASPISAAAGPAAAMAAEAPPLPLDAVSTPEVDTPEEVADALARLADLRDRGAITPEEYEAKKQELLERL